ncbi:MAG: SUMF1/EgtB/PvdO family nonheme iron enzyme [Opitutaceae bacterium]|nr:SUMF1/EgtB/PvdO family nonheme iron enzyme [Opitutaceae bacterium]
MKTMTKLMGVGIAAFFLTSGSMAQITIDTVTVGNPGNTADSTGFGAVGYSYAIGKYEVTNTQYAAFLNAVAATDSYALYNTSMGSEAYGGITRSGSSGSYAYAVKSGYENKPVTYVSFWDATRFANWLNNGQGSASTETGSYTLGGVTNPVNNTVTRNGGANWVVSSENEWYKAAYYDPTLNSGTGGYWEYPVRSNTLGDNTAFTATNSANYNDGDYAVFNGAGTDGALPVGSYPNASSYYGTFDQGGNVWEWNEQIYANDYRGKRAGSWVDGYGLDRSYSDPSRVATYEDGSYGFRVASLAPIPEPGTCAAALGAVSLAIVLLRRRKA